ncbi:phosphoglycolate phosphatase [Ktedonobacteria bacterium brp13]|nr:phosphoglycolate phosphatase [Ktedonobacteria bacterium brp13]
MEKRLHTAIHGVVFDVDGTLIDSNDANAHAWVHAMKEQGHDVPFERVRPLIGMGGDKILPVTLHIEKNSEEGKRISERRKAIFKEQYLPHLKPFPQALTMLHLICRQGLKMAIATSAEPDELDELLKLIDEHAKDLFENATTSKDVPSSKPDDDIIKVAVDRIKIPLEHLLMVGDTAYDIEAAGKAGIRTVALRSGGWSDEDLKDALVIYNDPADIVAHFSTSPFVQGI